MSLKVLKESREELLMSYSIRFDTHSDGGYAFDCDENGNVLDTLTPLGMENYKKCKSGEIKLYRPPYINEYRRLVRHPMVCKCHCGKELPMECDPEGIVYCYCGKTYNPSGQELLPRSQWEERYEDDY